MRRLMEGVTSGFVGFSWCYGKGNELQSNLSGLDLKFSLFQRTTLRVLNLVSLPQASTSSSLVWNDSYLSSLHLLRALASPSLSSMTPEWRPPPCSDSNSARRKCWLERYCRLHHTQDWHTVHPASHDRAFHLSNVPGPRLKLRGESRRHSARRERSRLR